MADHRTPGDRVQAAEIRAWARDNGWPELTDRGKLPVTVREAWDAAQDQAADPDGPDDLSELDETDLDDEPGIDPFDPLLDDDGPGLPPPADLDEARKRAGKQPGSAHLTRGRRGKREPKPDQPPVKVTAAVRRDIEGKVAFWLLIPAEPWMRVDPYCGQAYADNLENIAVKMTPLLCQSPAIVRWFGKSTTFIQVTELAMACRPVAEAVIAHHVTKRIVLDSLGQPVEVANGGMDFAPYSRQPAA